MYRGWGVAYRIEGGSVVERSMDAMKTEGFSPGSTDAARGRTVKIVAASVVVAALLLAGLAVAWAQTRPVEPAGETVGQYDGNFKILLDGRVEEQVMLEATVSPDGRVSGSWDYSASIDGEDGRVDWTTSGEFDGRFVEPYEFVATGEVAEAPPLTGGGAGFLNGDVRVRGTLSDDGLLLGTVFVGEETVMFQAVREPADG
jgi:hypothetical protein